MSKRPSFVPDKANIAAGVPPLHIEWRAATTQPLILPNGVYVPVGERLSTEMLQKIAGYFGSGKKVPDRCIPADQTTTDVLLGAMMDYGISPVTGKDINSEHVNNCHVLAAIGVAREGNQPTDHLALYAHINPAARLLETNAFSAHLRERIRTLCKKTHQYTRDILIAGGSIDPTNEQRADVTCALCILSIEHISDLCGNELGVEPTVTRPELEDLDTHISLATQLRRLIVQPGMQPQVQFPEEHLPSIFLASQARSYIEKMRSIMEWRR